MAHGLLEPWILNGIHSSGCVADPKVLQSLICSGKLTIQIARLRLAAASQQGVLAGQSCMDRIAWTDLAGQSWLAKVAWTELDGQNWLARVEGLGLDGQSWMAQVGS